MTFLTSQTSSEGTKVQTSECILKPTEVEFVKVLPTETKKADSSLPQVKANIRVLKEGEQTGAGAKPSFIIGCGGSPCTTPPPEMLEGGWIWNQLQNQWVCRPCA